MKEGYDKLQDRVEEVKNQLEALIEYEVDGIEDINESLENLKDNIEEVGGEMVENLEEFAESIEEMVSEKQKNDCNFEELALHLKNNASTSLIEPVKKGDWEQKITRLKSNVDEMYNNFTRALESAVEVYKKTFVKV